MKTSKLVETLKCLHPEEIARLELFLAAAYFHGHDPDEPILALCRYLTRFHPAYDQAGLEREQVYCALFPGETVVRSRLEKLMTRLLKEVRRFIAFEMQRQETTETDLELLTARFLRERNHFPEYERLIKNLRSHLEQQGIRDVDYFQRLYRLEEEYCSYRTWFNNRKTDLNLAPAIQALDTYFLLARLEYVVLYLSQAKTVPLPLEHSLFFMADIEPLLHRPPFDTVPLLQIYFAAYRLLAGDPADPEVFLHFTTLLQAHERVIPTEKNKDFQALARNYCIREFNRGNETFFKIAFDLYKLHLEKGYLYRNGMLQAVIVKNLVSMGLRMHEHDWVFRFLEDHRHRIMGITHPEEAYRFNLAVYYFHKRDFERVNEHLDAVYDDLFYKLAAKRLEIKMLYEMQSPVLESRIEAFNILIFRMGGRQLSDVYVAGNKQFVAFLRRILKPITFQNSKRIRKIKADLLEAPTVVEKEWLLEVLER